MWCVPHVVMVPFSPAGLSLLEMLRECGVLGRQYWFPSVQLDLVCWKCSGNVVCSTCSNGFFQSSWTWSAGNAQGMWCVGKAVLVPFSPAGLGLLEMLRECGVLGKQYWFPLVQLDLVCCKCSGNVVCSTCSNGYFQFSWT